MPNSFGSSGLTIATLNEITSSLSSSMLSIYPNANLNQNSPDGQTINIYAQATEDALELLQQINSGFDPDQAIGATLDERVAINNIQRQGGTFTIVGITINVSSSSPSITLSGLDANFNNINGVGYTVSDDSGNQYILIDTTTLTPGSSSTLDFRSQTLGAIVPVAATITNPVTVVLGVTSVNNASGPLVIGQNQETDAQLRLRRQKSVALASNGYLNGLLGTVLNIPGVTGAVLYENVSNITDANGIPAHGIWLVVDGGANTDIANAIYNKISYGANMKGSVSIPITTPSGGIFDALFDRPTSEPLYIKFNIQPTTTSSSFNTAGIKSYIVDNKTYPIGGYADQASLTVLAIAAINATGGVGVPNEVMISDDGSSFVDYLTPSTLGSQFTLSTSNIAITVL